jgi:NodT family efflux transporter outer membrane factor (OMF) lipoprotein
LTLIASVASTAVSAAGTRARMKATQDIIQAERQAVNIAQNQYQVGAAAYADVLRARSQLLGTLATLPSLKRELAQYRHRLANLVGASPATVKLPTIHIADLTLPKQLPVSLPSSLVRSRPDILAAEQSLHAATAQIGVRTAALFPDITLSASPGRSADTFPDLYNIPSGIFSVAAQLLVPLFHGFTLRAQRREALAAEQESFANYKQTVLSAFQEVADAMRSLEEDAKSLKAEYRYLQASKQSLKLDRTRFKAGATGFLTVLTDERQFQQARINYTQAQVTRYQDTVLFFQAVKGGEGQLSSVPNVASRPATGASTSAPSSSGSAGGSLPTATTTTGSIG